MPKYVEAGKYYDEAGNPIAPGTPRVVVGRRAADFPPGWRFPGLIVERPCARCRAVLILEAAGPHQDVVHVCMQCAGIEPLPLEAPR